MLTLAERILYGVVGSWTAGRAGVAFIVAFALVRANPESPPGSFYDSFIGVLLIVALLLLAAGLAGIHALQKGNYGRIGRAGFYTVVVAALVEVVAFVARLFGSTALEFVELLGILHDSGIRALWSGHAAS